MCPGGHGGYGYINNNYELRIEKNKKARKVTDKILFEKYGVENPSQLKEVKEKLRIKTKERWSKIPKSERKQLYDWTGKQFTQSHKDNISKANSISQLGSRNSQYGTIWITDGKVNKKIKKNDSLPFGFRKGRIMTIKCDCSSEAEQYVANVQVEIAKFSSRSKIYEQAAKTAD